MVATVKELRALGAVSVRVSRDAVTCRFAGPPEPARTSLDERESAEERKEREAAAVRERKRLEDWSA